MALAEGAAFEPPPGVRQRRDECRGGGRLRGGRPPPRPWDTGEKLGSSQPQPTPRPWSLFVGWMDLKTQRLLIPEPISFAANWRKKNTLLCQFENVLIFWDQFFGNSEKIIWIFAAIISPQMTHNRIPSPHGGRVPDTTVKLVALTEWAIDLHTQTEAEIQDRIPAVRHNDKTMLLLFADFIWLPKSRTSEGSKLLYSRWGIIFLWAHWFGLPVSVWLCSDEGRRPILFKGRYI